LSNWASALGVLNDNMLSTTVDPPVCALYIAHMSQSDSNDQIDLDLKKLEVRVEELIRACSQLKSENSSLKVRQEGLVAERAALIEKTELARTRVEAMIGRLKALETDS